MELIIAVVSLAVFVALVWAAIAAASALERIAKEAAQMRQILGIIAETELARGKNELANIELATGSAESAHLYPMPTPHGESEANKRAAKINSIMRG
jgi:hypothetical protein